MSKLLLSPSRGSVEPIYVCRFFLILVIQAGFGVGVLVEPEPRLVSPPSRRMCRNFCVRAHVPLFLVSVSSSFLHPLS